jgi:hypothetical protein
MDKFNINTVDQLLVEVFGSYEEVSKEQSIFCSINANLGDILKDSRLIFVE